MAIFNSYMLVYQRVRPPHFLKPMDSHFSPFLGYFQKGKVKHHLEQTQDEDRIDTRHLLWHYGTGRCTRYTIYIYILYINTYIHKLQDSYWYLLINFRNSGNWISRQESATGLVMAPSPFWDGTVAPSPLSISPNPSVLLRFAKRNLRLFAVITSHDKWGVILRSSGSRISLTLLMYIYIYICICIYISRLFVTCKNQVASDFEP